MRQLIINLDTENNQSKKNEVINMLEEMGVEYQTSERQSMEEYNNELSEAESEIAKGDCITAQELKKESRSW
jgi:hypothetical protein